MLQTPGQRAASYWFIDGLPEIVTGVEFLLWGAVGILGGLILLHHPKAYLPGWLAALVVFSMAVWPGWDRRITEFLKAWVTYPRTGYVQSPIDEQQKPLIEPFTFLRLRDRPAPEENMTSFRLRALLVLWVGWQIPGQVLNGFSNQVEQPWSTPVAMLALAVALYALNRNLERAYAWWFVLLLPAAGLLAMPLNLRADLRQFLVPAISGIWLLARGAWTLAGYLRKNPRPVAGEEVPA
jgi:hypothetical protein